MRGKYGRFPRTRFQISGLMPQASKVLRWVFLETTRREATKHPCNSEYTLLRVVINDVSTCQLTLAPAAHYLQSSPSHGRKQQETNTALTENKEGTLQIHYKTWRNPTFCLH
jgi:hypothetical protein